LLKSGLDESNRLEIDDSICTTEDMDVFSKDMEQLSELRLASAEKSPQCGLEDEVMLPAVLLASEEVDASDDRPEILLIQKELLLVIREMDDFCRIMGGLDDMVVWRNHLAQKKLSLNKNKYASRGFGALWKNLDPKMSSGQYLVVVEWAEDSSICLILHDCKRFSRRWAQAATTY
jgi:hypothetical protein